MTEIMNAASAYMAGLEKHERMSTDEERAIFVTKRTITHDIWRGLCRTSLVLKKAGEWKRKLEGGAGMMDSIIDMREEGRTRNISDEKRRDLILKLRRLEKCFAGCRYFDRFLHAKVDDDVVNEVVDLLESMPVYPDVFDDIAGAMIPTRDRIIGIRDRMYEVAGTYGIEREKYERQFVKWSTGTIVIPATWNRFLRNETGLVSECLGEIRELVAKIGVEFPELLQLDRSFEENCRRLFELKNSLIENNLRLVPWVIGKFFAGAGVDMGDLIQEGNLGLISAVNRFGEDKECKFSTYAILRIRGRIFRYLSTKRDAVNVPYYVTSELRKLNDIKQKLHHNTGRSASRDDLIRETGLSGKTIDRLREHENHAVLSLDAPIGRTDSETENLTWMDMLKDENAVMPDESAIGADRRRLLEQVLLGLSRREEDVIRKLFGLGVREHAISEIARIYSCTRQNIDLIKQKALKKMRCDINERNVLKIKPGMV